MEEGDLNCNDQLTILIDFYLDLFTFYKNHLYSFVMRRMLFSLWTETMYCIEFILIKRTYKKELGGIKMLLDSLPIIADLFIGEGKHHGYSYG